MSKTRKILIAELKQRLLPVLLDRGFGILPLSGQENDGEVGRAFPFGRLGRKKGGDLQLVEIQMDKHGSAKFVFNLGVAPPGGLSLPMGKFSQNELGVSHLPVAYRLYSSRVGMAWFSLPWFFPLDAGSRVSKTVDRAMGLLTEIEAWFDKGLVGPHLRWYGHDWAKIVRGQPDLPDKKK